MIYSDKNSDKKPIAQKKIYHITLWGILVNALLSLIKVTAGSVVNSVALIADGIHSLSDLLTDFAVLISSRAGRRPPDKNHQYGHGKFETVGAQFIGVVLFIVGVGICRSSITSLIRGEKYFPGLTVVCVAFISVVSKEILFQVTRKIALTHRSSSLYANAWHHRSDAFSSLAVILGGLAGMAGFGFGDQIAGMVVGVMIILVAVKLIIDGFKELSEHSIDEEMVKKIQQVLKNHPEICHWHKLRTRKIGSEIFVDVHIHVNPQLTVKLSHDLTLEIENNIEEILQIPVNTLIHVEPCTPEEINGTAS
ncbi:cation transporter [candidate division KSB1 bacterium]|nr:cation transporter [candidate division KSB1 bacterium]